MGKSQLSQLPLRMKRLTIPQIDATITRLQEAYEAYIDGTQADCEVFNRLEATKVPDAELAAQFGISMKELPLPSHVEDRFAKEAMRRRDMRKALWENHACGRKPDCRDEGDIFGFFRCRRFGFDFESPNSMPEHVEEVLGYLYELRSAAHERRTPNFEHIEVRREWDLSICSAYHIPWLGISKSPSA